MLDKCFIRFDRRCTIALICMFVCLCVYAFIGFFLFHICKASLRLPRADSKKFKLILISVIWRCDACLYNTCTCYMYTTGSGLLYMEFNTWSCERSLLYSQFCFADSLLTETINRNRSKKSNDLIRTQQVKDCNGGERQYIWLSWLHCLLLA